MLIRLLIFLSRLISCEVFPTAMGAAKIIKAIILNFSLEAFSLGVNEDKIINIMIIPPMNSK